MVEGPPKALARLKNAPPDKQKYIWVFGDDKNGPACIRTEPPADTKGCKPLQAIVAHLVLDEWEEIGDG